MKRELRANICHKFVDDYDIVNAHPSILLSFVDGKFLPDQFKHLKRYVKNRKDVLKEMLDEGCPEEDSKACILKIIPRNPEHNFNPKTTFERDFDQEIHKLRDLILSSEAREGRVWIDCATKKHPGAALSVFLNQ